MHVRRVRKYYHFFKSLQGIEERGVDVIHKHEVPLQWLHKKLSHNQFLTLSGILVGCTAGIAGVGLKAMVHYIQQVITQDYHLPYQLLFYLIFPVIGIVATVLVVKYFFRGREDKGIPNVLSEIAQKSSFMRLSKTYSQLIQSAITVGFGGSAGLESPIAVTGAAIGSNYGRIYRMNYKDRTLLLAAGSAAGIASAFDAPVAGVMFAIEIILAGVVFSDFIPLIIASVCGALLSKMILGSDIILHFRLKQPFNYHYVPYYIVLGFVAGFYSRYYSVIAHQLHMFLHAKFKNKLMLGLCGGLMLSVLCFVFPPLFGEGYMSVKTLVDQSAGQLMYTSLFNTMAANQWVILGFVGLVCLFKVFATTITISSGGNGGNFAPSLVAGAFMGYFFAMLCRLLHIADLPVANFAIVGMAGAMSGILYAPLTSIFLIAEATGGYDLFIPLMIVSTASFLIVKRFSPYSLDVKPLVEAGKIFGKRQDRNLLSLLHTHDIIEKDIRTISPGATLRELVELIKVSKRNMFGVLNERHELEGIVMLDDIKEVMFKHEMYNNTFIRQLMKDPPAFIDVNESMQLVMKKFDETLAWNLPVTHGKKFIGFISKSSLLNSYRKLLIAHSPDEE
jgi:CIC family chloride channel protein